ncbi:Ig-like domain-containing protein [Pseudomonas frederiksbergensis]|uniref:Ig-like domain-containing protein n=1 Tax=Pseudomonas frederiksbergensis TaxID=104087 RepID=UPI003D215E30
MNEAMVIPVLDDIDDTQTDIKPFPQSDGPGVRRIFPPYIPGQIESIDFAPAEVGVNHPMLYVHKDGLKVLAENDAVRLLIGRQEVAKTVLPEDHGNRDIELYILAEKIPSGVHYLSAEVRRSSGNQNPETARVSVWFKLDTPGGLDPEPDLPGHQLLKPAQLQLPDGTPINLIDKEVAKDGVTAIVPHWLFMEKGDVVYLHFHGIVVQRTVLAEEVGKDIDVFISSQAIADAGPADPAIVVYQTRDQVHNVSAFSERATIVSDPGVDWLYPPIVPLADNYDRIRLDDVGYDELDVEVVTRPGFVLKETLQLNWLATTESGETIEHSEEQTITRLGIQLFKIPNAIVRASTPGLVQLDYRRTRLDNTQDPSERYFLSTIGARLRLPAPRVPDLVGGTLDPALVRTVVLCGPDERIKKGYRVTLTWQGKTASQLPHLYQTYRDVSDQLEGQEIPFVVTAKDIAPLNRGSVEVSYEVTDASLLVPLESGSLTARIGKVDAQLPIANVVGTVDNVLKPADVPFGTDIEVPAAPYTKVGDVVHVEGRGDENVPIFRDRLLIEPGKEGKGLEFWLSAEYIQLLYLNQFFSLLWWIERPNALPQTSATLELFIGDPAQALQPPTVRRAPGGVLNPLENAEGATARVHLSNPRPGDTVQLIVKGAAGAGSPTFEPQPLNADNRANFALTTAFIAENLGREVTISYDVIQGTQRMSSPALSLNVQRIADQDANLTKPSITQAGNSTLIDLRTFSGDLTCIVPTPLPIPVVGQRVWIDISSSGSAPLRVRDGIGISAAEIISGLSATASRTWFAALNDLAECVVTCKIALGSNDNESSALTLPLVQYTVKVTAALAIDSSPMNLNGIKLIPDGNYGLQAREVPRNTAIRLPSGGTPPYTYVSANPAVASVNASGKVAGLKNGSTTITVKDAASQSVSYSVRVTNVYRMRLNDSDLTPNQAVIWLRSVGATMINNSGQPMGWGVKQSNFIDITPIYGGRGLKYERYVSLNLDYPNSYVIAPSLLQNNGAEGARNVLLTSTWKARALAYIPT